MNWKHFLKPDWKKIAIFLVLFVLTFYLFGKTLTCTGDECSNYPITIVLLVSSYILSCLIVWIYTKVRKK